MSLKSKIFIGFIISVLIVFSIFSLYTFSQTSKIITDKEKEALDLLSSSIEIQMEDQLDSAELSVLSIANNIEIQKAFALKDRNMLEDMLLPVYEELSHEVSQIQFHLPDSTSFLRLHQPEKFGDSLKDFRFTVNEANEKQTIIRGLEEGVAGYGFRVVVPIDYQGKHIGTVEYGSDFGESFFQELKDNYEGEYMSYQFTADDETSLLNSTIENDEWHIESSMDLEAIKDGQTLYLTSKDKLNNVLLLPYKDYRGEVGGYIKVVQSRAGLVQDISNIRIKAITYTLILLAVLLALFYIFLKYSLKPTEELVHITNNVATGDLTQNIVVKSKDEIAAIGTAFNQMTSSLRDVIGKSDEISARVASTSQQLSASSEEVTAACEEVASSMTHLNESANHQFESIQNSNISIKHMLESINDVSTSIGEIDNSSRNTLSLAEEGIKSSNEVVEKINDLKDSTDKTTKDIELLNESSREIQGIADVIRDIADQTNLLALNAAIEAARAGESGKGFAVVANEVKELAEQSANSSDQIAHITSDIQIQIDTAIGAMMQNNGEVELAVDMVDKTSNNFGIILDNINIVAGQIQNVSTLTQSVSQDAENITSNFNNMIDLSNDTAEESEGVAASAQQQTAAIEEIASSSINLADMAQELQNSISVFKY